MPVRARRVPRDASEKVGGTCLPPPWLKEDTFFFIAYVEKEVCEKQIGHFPTLPFRTVFLKRGEKEG